MQNEKGLSKTDSSSSQDAERRNFRALCRFKALVRRVIANSKWLMEKSDFKPNLKKIKKNIIRVLYGAPKPEHGLDLYVKSLFCKSAELRTNDEKDFLYKIIKDLVFFKDYPEEVKQSLAAVAKFVYYGPNRMILREGDEGQSLYYLILGKIHVYKKCYNTVLKVWENEQVATLDSGETIGMTSIIYNVRRSATVITQSTCELLYIVKEDFDNILRPTMYKQWEDIKYFMSRFVYFSTLNEAEIREGCLFGKIKKFEADETIFGDGIGKMNFVYFVVSGRCCLIEVLKISARQTNNKTLYRMYTPPKNNPSEKADRILSKDIKDDENILKCTDKKSQMNTKIPKPSKEKVETIFMQICIIDEGGCFNLGESMENRRIVAEENVTCLLFPSHWIWQKNTADIWSRVKYFLKRKIPSTEEVFKSFVQNKRWEEYKNKLLNDIVNEKRAVNQTTIHDVPYSIRMSNKRY